MTPSALAAALAPKLAGTWNLERQLTESLDFFISFSSLASLLPAPGQANYAAGNAFLDAHAHWRQACGKPALSVNWGPWADVGFGATEEGLRAHQRLESFGMRRLSPNQALGALDALMGIESVQAVVVNVDWEILTRVDSMLAGLPLLKEVAGLAPVSTSSLRHMPGTSPVEAGETVYSEVAQIVAGVLRQPRVELRIDEPLPNLGLDSLMAMEIKNRILSQMDVNIPVSQFLGGASVRALANCVATDLKFRQIAAPHGAPEVELATEEFAL